MRDCQSNCSKGMTSLFPTPAYPHTCSYLSLPTTTQTHTHRPEADDLKAMQQELSSLHLLMEQSSGEHERKMQLLSVEKQRIEDDKTR